MLHSCLQEMGRHRTSDRGNEKFVQWKESVQRQGVTENADDHDSHSKGRQKKLTRRQTSLLSSLAATMQGPDEEQEGPATSAAAVGNDTGVGTSSPNTPEGHSSPPPPRFKPPRQMQNRRSHVPLPKSTVSVGAYATPSDMAPDVNHQRVAPRNSVQGESDPPAQGIERTAGPHHRRPLQGNAIKYTDFSVLYAIQCERVMR